MDPYHNQYSTRWQTIIDESCIRIEDGYPTADSLSLHPDHYRCVLISKKNFQHTLIGCLVSLITFPSASSCFALVSFYIFDCLIPIELRLFELLLNDHQKVLTKAGICHSISFALISKKLIGF